MHPIPTPASGFSVPDPGVQERTHFVSTDDIFAAPAPSVIPESPTSPNAFVRTVSGGTQTRPRLYNLLAGLESQFSIKYEIGYFTYLYDSLLSLQNYVKKNLLDF